MWTIDFVDIAQREERPISFDVLLDRRRRRPGTRLRRDTVVGAAETTTKAKANDGRKGNVAADRIPKRQWTGE